MKDKTIKFSPFVNQLDEMLTNYVQELPNSFWNYINKKFIESNQTLPLAKAFKMEFVIDTNILFMEVRSMMLNNNSSFFLRVFVNPLIKVYAPSEIKVELFEKIKKKFPKEKATRDLDLDLCFQKAEELLKNIIIRDDLKEDSLNKAKSKLKNRDLDDVAFLALTFQVEGDGILTNDNDIKDQAEVKAWRLRDAGRLVSDFKKGTFSFTIIGTSLEIILKSIGGILASLWNNFIKTIEGILLFSASILTGGVNGILNMPPEIAGVVSIGIILILLLDKTRKATGELVKIVGKEVTKLLMQIKKIFFMLAELLKFIFNILKPILTGFAEIYTYLLLNTSNTMVRLNKDNDQSI
jgi:predicted nucleic acid-binding protein